jgi:hypothetical protein
MRFLGEVREVEEVREVKEDCSSSTASLLSPVTKGRTMANRATTKAKPNKY